MATLITKTGKRNVNSAEDIALLAPAQRGTHLIGYIGNDDAQVEVGSQVYIMKKDDMPLVDWAEELGVSAGNNVVNIVGLAEPPDGVYVAICHTQRGTNWCVVQKTGVDLRVGQLHNLNIKGHNEQVAESGA